MNSGNKKYFISKANYLLALPLKANTSPLTVDTASMSVLHGFGGSSLPGLGVGGGLGGRVGGRVVVEGRVSNLGIHTGTWPLLGGPGKNSDLFNT